MLKQKKFKVSNDKTDQVYEADDGTLILVRKGLPDKVSEEQKAQVFTLCLYVAIVDKKLEVQQIGTQRLVIGPHEVCLARHSCGCLGERLPEITEDLINKVLYLRDTLQENDLTGLPIVEPL